MATQLNQGFELRGHTRIWKNEELVFDKDNAIINGGTAITITPDGLKAYLAQCMYGGSVVNTPVAPVNRAIDDLFSTSNDGGSNYALEGNASVSASFASKDGIIIAATDGSVVDCFAMVTSNVAKTQNYGRKWKGEFTATAARQFGLAALGYGLISDTDPAPSAISAMFTTPYATQNFTTITLASGDKLTIEWEVYIA